MRERQKGSMWAPHWEWLGPNTVAMKTVVKEEGHHEGVKMRGPKAWGCRAE